MKFKQIFLWIAANWSEKSAQKFADKTNKVVEQISEMPESGSKTSKKDVRKVLISKHNWLFYKLGKKIIYILAIFDSRQNPKKKPY